MKYYKEIPWAVIVPLIGGLPIAMRNVFQSDPEYIMSYSPFQHNDKHFVSYLRKHGWDGEYHVLDSNEESVIPNVNVNEPTKYVEVIGAVCPCAGLSALSVTANADNNANQWMYASTEYVLKNRKPKIFWGENAPRLATQMGKKVADTLYELGKLYGYHFLIFSTESRIHGNPQIRPRTFYFFFKKEMFPKMPILSDIPVERCSYESLMQDCVLEDDNMNIPANPNTPSTNAYYRFLYDHIKAENHRDFIEKMCPMDSDESKGINLLAECIAYSKKNHTGFDYLIEWLDKNNFDRDAKRIRSVQKKFDDGKGAWMHGISISRNIIPSFVAHMPSSMVHPFEDRFLTIRECMRLMRMPEDFDLATDRPIRELNHICQNVIVTTAKLMCDQIKDIMNGFYKTTEGSYIIQIDKGNKSILQDRTPTDDKEIATLENFY